MMRERMSRPSSSDPNSCAHEGGESRVARLMWAGSWGAIHGAKIAQITKKTTNTTPIAASGLRRVNHGSEMAIADKFRCRITNLVPRGRRCRRRRELLAHPLLERIHVLFAPQEVLHKLVARSPPPGLQHRPPIPHRRRPRQQVVLVKLAEEVLGNHLVPQVAVIRGRKSSQGPEPNEHVRPR